MSSIRTAANARATGSRLSPAANLATSAGGTGRERTDHNGPRRPDPGPHHPARPRTVSIRCSCWPRRPARGAVSCADCVGQALDLDAGTLSVEPETRVVVNGEAQDGDGRTDIAQAGLARVHVD